MDVITFRAGTPIDPPLPAVSAWHALLDRCPNLGVVELQGLIESKRPPSRRDWASIVRGIERLLDDPGERRIALAHLRDVVGGRR